MRFLLPFLVALILAPSSTGPATIPSTQATALDGHPVNLPRDLYPRATILILGFSRNAANTSASWEKNVRGSLATIPAVGYYDIPVIEEAPAIIRPMIVRSIRKQVPDSLRHSFVPLATDEATWKQVAQYSPSGQDAAYVLLVDHAGKILWQTHDPFSSARFDSLSAETRKLAGNN